MKERFWNKITVEYLTYKAAVLSGTNGEIYNRCYEIDTMVNLYELLMEKGETLPEVCLEGLMQQENVLRSFYEEWLKRDDKCYQELENYVTDELRYLEVQKNDTERNSAVAC